jgi:hypothetical protein
MLEQATAFQEIKAQDQTGKGDHRHQADLGFVGYLHGAKLGFFPINVTRPARRRPLDQ